MAINATWTRDFPIQNLPVTVKCFPHSQIRTKSWLDDCHWQLASVVSIAKTGVLHSFTNHYCLGITWTSQPRPQGHLHITITAYCATVCQCQLSLHPPHQSSPAPTQCWPWLAPRSTNMYQVGCLFTGDKSHLQVFKWLWLLKTRKNGFLAVSLSDRSSQQDLWGKITCSLPTVSWNQWKSQITFVWSLLEKTRIPVIAHRKQHAFWWVFAVKSYGMGTEGQKGLGL